MTSAPHRPAREAGNELLVLARWEELAAWLLAHTGRWPRSARFSFARRVQDGALEIAELLVVARYEPKERARVLRDVNLRLERMRLLLRLAAGAAVMPRKPFETAMRGIDEVGRMLHGWRASLSARGRSRAPKEAGA